MRKIAEGKGILDTRQQEILDRYQGSDQKTVDSELTALLTEELIGNEQFIDKVVAEQPNIAMRFVKKIQNLIKLFKMSGEQRAEYKVLTLAENMYLRSAYDHGRQNLIQSIEQGREDNKQVQVDEQKDEVGVDQTLALQYNKKDLIGKTFPPYNESFSQANELAIRWAKQDSIKEGWKKLISFQNSWYLIKKYSVMDEGYQIVEEVREEDYDKYEKRLKSYEGADYATSIDESIRLYENGNAKQSIDSNETQRRESYLSVSPMASKRSAREGSGESSRRNSKQGNRNKHIVDYHFNDDGSQIVTYSDGTKETRWSLKGNGYDGYSMSNNARRAYANGEKPKSKWTKLAIIEAVEEIDSSKVDLVRKVNAEILRDRLLTYSSWHHTSKMYNVTDFYKVDEEVVQSMTEQNVAEWKEWYKNREVREQEYKQEQALQAEIEAKKQEERKAQRLEKSKKVQEKLEAIRQNMSNPLSFDNNFSTNQKAIEWVKENYPVLAQKENFNKLLANPAQNVAWVQLYAKKHNVNADDILAQFGYDGIDMLTENNVGQVRAFNYQGEITTNDFRYSLKDTVEKDVLSHYGATYRWTETGYILKDGTRLDLSGRRDGASGGHRTVDHRDIFDIYENIDGTEAMIEFMARGNIRVSPENPGINLQVEPTEEQYRLIQDFVERVGFKEEYFSVDFDDKFGDVVETLEYNGKVSGRKVVSDIRYYFKEGKLPYRSELSRFRWSLKESFEQGLNKYSESEIASIESNKMFKVAHSYEDVKKFIETSRKGTINQRLFIGKISDTTATKIYDEIGINVVGKSLALSSADIRHIFIKHGTNGTEMTRGQVAITQENFENIIDTLIEPDTVARSDENNVVGLKFQKEIGGRVTAITVMSEKRKALTLKSAWMQKEKQHISPPSNAEALNITSETLQSMDAVSNNSISKIEENVNTDDKNTPEYSRKSPAPSQVGDIIKAKGNLTTDKIFTKDEAKKIIADIEERLVFEDKGMVGTVKGVNELIDRLWKGLNKADKGEYTRVGVEIADYVVNHTVVEDIYECLYGDTEVNEAREVIKTLKQYFHKVKISDRVLGEIKHHFDDKASKVLSLWRAKEGGLAEPKSGVNKIIKNRCVKAKPCWDFWK